MPNIQCLQCGNDFYAKPSELNSGEGKYCSKECYGFSRRNRVELICGVCEKKFEVINSLKKSRKHCSQECYGISKKNGREIECITCNKVIYVSKSTIKKNKGRYCSIDCFLKSKSTTTIENLVECELINLNLNYQSQKRIGKWGIDFYIEDLNLVIECDGDYWHKEISIVEKDLRKNKWFREEGYNIIRLPEKEILIDAEEALMSRIYPFLQIKDGVNVTQRKARTNEKSS